MKRQVEKAVRRFQMFTHSDKILLPVSGGKDSIALWDILLKLHFKVHALHVQLGISEYSEKSADITKRFSEEKNAKLTIVNINEEYGFNIPLAVEKTKLPACSICGTTKRYVYNKFAQKENMDVIVTGHNMDDLAAQLRHSSSTWDLEGMLATYPVRPGKQGLIKRAKPLVYLTEKETLTYVITQKLPVFLEECPFSQGAWSIVEKQELNRIENKKPGFKYQYLTQFYKKAYPAIYEFEEKKKIKNDIKLKSCKICGAPTVKDYCWFCRTRAKILDIKLETN